MLRAALYIASYKWNIDKIEPAGCQDRPRIGAKNMGKTRRENGRVSQVKWKLQSFLLLQTLM